MQTTERAVGERLTADELSLIVLEMPHRGMAAEVRTWAEGLPLREYAIQQQGRTVWQRYDVEERGRTLLLTLPEDEVDVVFHALEGEHPLSLLLRARVWSLTGARELKTAAYIPEDERLRGLAGSSKPLNATPSQLYERTRIRPGTRR